MPAKKKKKAAKKAVKKNAKVAKKKLKKAVKKTKKTAKKTKKKIAKKSARAVKKLVTKAKKKAVKKLLKEAMVGRVTHYFGRIGVAIVELASPMKVGDIVRIRHGNQEYLETVTSMQIEHQPVAMAQKKDVVGLKVARKVPQGAVVLPA